MTEEFKVSGEEILKKVKEIIKEGNARKIIIKNEKDETIFKTDRVGPFLYFYFSD